MARSSTWTFEKVRSHALTCHFADEFKHKFKGAYCWAQRNDLLDQVQAGLIKKAFQGKDISNLDILTTAKEFDNRGDFKLQARVIYEEARKRGLMEKACAHMKFGSQGTRSQFA